MSNRPPDKELKLLSVEPMEIGSYFRDSYFKETYIVTSVPDIRRYRYAGKECWYNAGTARIATNEEKETISKQERELAETAAQQQLVA